MKEKNIWQLQEAKAKFSQVIKFACENGLQTITKNGEPIAVLLSQKEYEKLKQPKRTLVEFFEASPLQDIDLDISPRIVDQPRSLDL